MHVDLFMNYSCQTFRFIFHLCMFVSYIECGVIGFTYYKELIITSNCYFCIVGNKIHWQVGHANEFAFVLNY
jgi:hypothetical protein